MKISTKFFASSIIVMGAIAIGMGISIEVVQQAERSVIQRREKNSQSFMAVLNLHSALEEQIFALKDFVMLDRAPEDLVRYERSRAKFLLVLDELEILLPEAEGLELLRRRQKNLQKLTNGLKQNTSSLAERQQDIRGVNSFSNDITFSLKLLVEDVQELEQQAKTSANRLKRRVEIFQFILLGLLCLIVVAQFYLLLLPVLRSFYQLQQGVQKIGAGELNYRLKIQTGDEIEELADSFNQMAAQLSESYHGLEQKVTERTQELQSTNQDLNQTLAQLQKTQTQLIQSEKMSSIGQMVAGVAHEINNPINFVYGNLKPAQSYIQDLLYLVEQYQKDYPHPSESMVEILDDIDLEFLREDVHKLMNSMEIGAVRIRDIVKSLRTFSRLDEAEIKEADLHEGIDSTLMILHNRLKAKTDSPEIEVIKNYGDLPLVECYPGQLNQVFMNLLSNAIDALEENYKNTQKAGQIEISTQIIENDWIQINIKDNGIGIDPKTKSKLFDPFFTTKPIGKGTGLGLSISYQIVVDKHDGKLSCDSQLGEGTEFAIAIPCKQKNY